MNRRALVTGTSSGIGRAIAVRLIADGWLVAGLDLAPATLVDRGFDAIRVDLSDAGSRASLWPAIAEKGPFSVFVHAAGIMRGGPLGALDPDAGALMWRLHVEAATDLADRLTPILLDHGRLVMIGSRAARGIPLKSQYGATKAALVALARGWARELAARAITVNVVSPAAVDTPMLTDPARADIAPAALPPMGRLVAADEVAALVTFLVSPEASMITGQDIAICGGASL